MPYPKTPKIESGNPGPWEEDDHDHHAKRRGRGGSDFDKCVKAHQPTNPAADALVAPAADAAMSSVCAGKHLQISE
jgi:hypothetical protein